MRIARAGIFILVPLKDVPLDWFEGFITGESGQWVKPYYPLFVFRLPNGDRGTSKIKSWDYRVTFPPHSVLLPGGEGESLSRYWKCIDVSTRSSFSVDGVFF